MERHESGLFISIAMGNSSLLWSVSHINHASTIFHSVTLCLFTSGKKHNKARTLATEAINKIIL